MLTISLFLIFVTTCIVGYAVVPDIYNRVYVLHERRQQQISSNIEHIMSRQDALKISRFFILIPFIMAIVCYFVFPQELQLFGAVMGFIGGFLLPGFYIRFMTRKSREKFADQLIDALMIMSSSFRGGLSLIQALEAVVDEMPDPINKEFSIVLGENKMGVSLEEALAHLYNRMPSVPLQQMITAILLARETGGNLPAIFSRIVTTIRESKKIQQNLQTLTLQGRIQSVVMSLLPIGFAFVVYSANRQIFEHMLHSNLGQALLMYAVISELIGVFWIIRISTFAEY